MQLSKDQRFLTDEKVLSWFSHYSSTRAGPFLDIGSGKGAILKRLPSNRVGVERDLAFINDLAGDVIIWKDWLTHQGTLDSKVVVGNLPFARAVDHLIKAYNCCPLATDFAVIVEHGVAKSMIAKGKLGFLIRSLFDIQQMYPIPGSSFFPSVKTTAGLLVMKRRTILTSSTLEILRKNLGTLTCPRKKLKYSYPKIPESLAHKRIDELIPVEEDDLRSFLCKD